MARNFTGLTIISFNLDHLAVWLSASGVEIRFSVDLSAAVENLVNFSKI